MAKNIQDLRRKAGFRSGRDFAVELGIPPSTYARYEHTPEAIPLRQAWTIADRLGCSIDMVVGREPVDVEDMRGDVQKYYDALSGDARSLMDDFMEFVSLREARDAARRQREEEYRFASYARYYERRFLQLVDEGGHTAETILYGSSDEVRTAYEEFVRACFADKRSEAIEERCNMLRSEIGARLEMADFGDGEGTSLAATSGILPEDEVERSVGEERERIEAELEESDEGVIAQVMAAYDRLHPEEPQLAAMPMRDFMSHRKR